MTERKPVRDNEKEPSASVSQSELLITLFRLGASSFSAAMSRILVDFGRLPETVTARDCNVGKRRHRKTRATQVGKLVEGGF